MQIGSGSSPRSAQGAPAGSGHGARARVQSIVDQTAHAAKQQGHQANGIQNRVNQAIEAFQRDGNPAHLLEAIANLQSMVQLSTQLVHATSASASDLARAAAGGAAASVPSIAQAAKPPAATSFVTPNPSAADVARLADDIRKQIKHTADNLRNAAEGAVRSIADAAKHVMEGERLAREEGLHGGLLRGGQKGAGAGAGAAGGGSFNRAAGSIGGGR
jgi:hypothetical protein